MPRLKGKTVLITGAAGGFGREMIRQFLQAGSYLLLSDCDRMATHEAVTDVARALDQKHVTGRVLGYIAADLVDNQGCEQVYSQAMAICPEIDMLVNNAGIGSSGAFIDTPQEKWERLLAVNLLAPMRLTALFLPAMMARRSGHIVNIASIAGVIPAASLTAYSTSKFGLRGFSEALAAELAPYGVGVTAIYPFFARTPILNSEQFGSAPHPSLPDWMIYDPAFIIAELLAGLEADKQRIVPGVMATQLDTIQRLAPGALPRLMRLTKQGKGES
jgi:short-subunit dehydrogenase